MQKIFLIIALVLLAVVGVHNYRIKHRQLPAPLPILVTSFPRSGGTSITHTLSNFFRSPILHSANGLDQLIKKRGLCSYRELPSDELEKFEKLVIHVRDPRQALVSWVHHVDKLKTHNHLDKLRPYNEPPEEYFSWNFETKIDWQIEHFYINSISWLQDWLAYADTLESGKVKITTYDNLKIQPLSFYRELIAFYGGKPKKFKQKHLPEISPGVSLRYRKADPKEWRQVLTLEQQEHITSLLPKELSSRFNWE